MAINYIGDDYMTKYNMQKEIWKDIKGYEGIYQISNKGNVKALPKQMWNGTGFFITKEKLLKPNPQKGGYLNVQLYKLGKKKPFGIHRLVAKHFICNEEKKEQVNHIDGITSNNDVSNLEWATPKENIKHAMENNLFDPKGNRGKFGRPVEQYSLDGEYIQSYSSSAIAGAKFSLHASSSIARACKSERLTAYGYKWKYVN